MPCVFCGTNGPMSREHVFPAWMGDLFPEMADEQLDHSRRYENLTDGRPVEENTWASGAFTQTVRDVCEPCNNGWMSGLETAAKPLLSAAITGESRSFSITEQFTIATWATKTVLVAVRAMPGGRDLVSSEMYRWFRENQAPMPNEIVWLGRYDGDGQWPTTFMLHGAGYGPPDQPQPSYKDAVKGFHAVFAVGHLALCVYGIEKSGVLGHSNEKRTLIWPNAEGDIWWPPQHSLSMVDLKAESAELPSPPA